MEIKKETVFKTVKDRKLKKKHYERNRHKKFLRRVWHECIHINSNEKNNIQEQRHFSTAVYKLWLLSKWLSDQLENKRIQVINDIIKIEIEEWLHSHPKYWADMDGRYIRTYLYVCHVEPCILLLIRLLFDPR